MKTVYFILIFIFAFLSSCVSTRRVSDSLVEERLEHVEHIGKDSVVLLSCLTLTDTVRIIDSVYVVVDTTGNVVRESRWHSEKGKSVATSVDTVVVVKADTVFVVYDDKVSKEKEVVKVEKKPTRFFIMMGILFIALLYAFIREFRKHG